MAKPYDVNLRQQVFEAECGGMTAPQIAARFDVCTRPISRWIARFHADGTLRPKDGKPGPRLILGSQHRAAAHELMKANASDTAVQLAIRIEK